MAKLTGEKLAAAKRRAAHARGARWGATPRPEEPEPKAAPRLASTRALRPLPAPVRAKGSAINDTMANLREWLFLKAGGNRSEDAIVTVAFIFRIEGEQHTITAKRARIGDILGHCWRISDKHTGTVRKPSDGGPSHHKQGE